MGGGALDSWAAGPRSVRRTVAQFAVTGLVAVALLGFVAVQLLRSSGTSDAIADAKRLSRLAGDSIAAPLLTPALLRGEPGAVRRLDRALRRPVVRGPFVRVKVWDADGPDRLLRRAPADRGALRPRRRGPRGAAPRQARRGDQRPVGAREPVRAPVRAAARGLRRHPGAGRPAPAVRVLPAVQLDRRQRPAHVAALPARAARRPAAARARAGAARLPAGAAPGRARARARRAAAARARRVGGRAAAHRARPPRRSGADARRRRVLARRRRRADRRPRPAGPLHGRRRGGPDAPDDARAAQHARRPLPRLARALRPARPGLRPARSPGRRRPRDELRRARGPARSRPTSRRCCSASRASACTTSASTRARAASRSRLAAGRRDRKADRHRRRERVRAGRPAAATRASGCGCSPTCWPRRAGACGVDAAPGHGTVVEAEVPA